MAWFWASALALLLLALWLVPGTLWRRPARTGAGLSASESNLAVHRAQLRQIDDELAQGAIDAAQHQALRGEIERRVLDEESVAAAAQRRGSPHGTMWLLLVAMPVLAFGLYALVGTPAALSPQAQQAAGDATPEQVEAMLAQLAQRMEQRPPGNVADAEGWVMLGRGYAMLQRYPDASRAFARALQLNPDDARILVDQADVLAMQQGGQLQGEPQRLIEQALQRDPSNLKALALAGTAAFERNDHAAAVDYWSRARATVPAGSEFAQGLDRSIAEARAAGSGSGSVARAASASAAMPSTAASATPSTTPSTTTSATPSGAAAAAQAGAAPGAAAVAQAATPAAAPITGRVRIAPALAARIAPGDTLFVFARAVDGPRMPLATLKRSAAELPLEFKLDDSTAMSPELKLSGFANVVIVARVSKTGDAMPRSGDLEGQSPPLAGRRSGVEVLIDSVRP